MQWNLCSSSGPPATVVLKLDRDKADNLDSRAAGTRVADGRVLVAAEHLLEIPLHDHVPGGGPAVPGQYHPAFAGRGDDRGAVRQVLDRLAAGRGLASPVGAAGQQPG